MLQEEDHGLKVHLVDSRQLSAADVQVSLLLLVKVENLDEFVNPEGYSDKQSR